MTEYEQVREQMGQLLYDRLGQPYSTTHIQGSVIPWSGLMEETRE